MATSPKVTTISTHSESDALEQTLRGIGAYADSRRPRRAVSDKLTIARDTIISAFENKVFKGSDTVNSAIKELRAYRMIAPSTSITTENPIKIIPISQPVQSNKQDIAVEVKGLPHDDVWVWGNQSRHEKDNSTGVANIYGACGNADLPGVPTKDDDHLEGATGVVDFITSDTKRPNLIRTVRGLGHKFETVNSCSETVTSQASLGSVT